MKQELKKKYKKILLTITSIAIITSLLIPKKIKVNITKNENLINNHNYYGTTSAGDIYIAEKKEIETLISNNIEGIFIIDERKTEDPNLIILSSCEITSKKQMLEIITILQLYEELYPTEWDRTTQSMLNEWEIHNIFYNLNYKTDHTHDVDLNNDDEKIYDNKALTYILRNNIK